MLQVELSLFFVHRDHCTKKSNRAVKMRKMKLNFAAILREFVSLHVRQYATDYEGKFCLELFDSRRKDTLLGAKTSTDPFSLRDVDTIVFGTLPCTVLRLIETLVGTTTFLDMQVEL